jgi:enterochelin esterase-like enzyme
VPRIYALLTLFWCSWAFNSHAQSNSGLASHTITNTLRIPVNRFGTNLVRTNARPQYAFIPAPGGGGWGDQDQTDPEGAFNRVFRSGVAGQLVSYLVSLPENYETSPQMRYPVIYYLHGMGSNHRSALQFIQRIRSAVRDGRMRATIVVGVNGLPNSWFCDSADGRWPSESVITRELIPFIDHSYRTIPFRSGRALEGFSMGGFGVIHLGFKYPEMFGALSSLGGPLLDAEFVATNPHESTRQIFNEVFGRNRDLCRANCPMNLLLQNAARVRNGTAVRIWIGEEDQNLESNKVFRDKMKQLQVPCFFESFPGVGHNPNPMYEERGDEAFEFYEKAFAASDPYLKALMARTASVPVPK